MQGLSFLASPEHFFPPYAAYWISFLIEVVVPSLHVTEQADQSLNSDHVQSTTKKFTLTESELILDIDVLLSLIDYRYVINHIKTRLPGPLNPERIFVIWLT